MRGKTQEQDVVFCISLWRVDGKEPALGGIVALNCAHPTPPMGTSQEQQFCIETTVTLHFAAFEAPQRRPTCGSGSPETGKNTSERAGKTGERAPQRGLHFSQSRSALCTQPIFGAQWQSSRCLRTILSKIGPDSATAVEPRFPVPGGGEQCAFHCASVFSFFDRYEWKRSRGREQK